MSKVSNEMERWSTVVENDGFEEGGHQGRIEIDYVSSRLYHFRKGGNGARF